MYLSKSQNGTLLLHNCSHSYIPHKDCDCSNTALSALTQAKLPHTLVRNDSFESKSGKRRDEIPSGCVPPHEVHPPPVYTGVTLCYSVLLLPSQLSPCFPLPFPWEPQNRSQQNGGFSPSRKAEAWPAMGSHLSD